MFEHHVHPDCNSRLWIGIILAMTLFAILLLLCPHPNINCQFINKQLRQSENMQTSKTVAMPNCSHNCATNAEWMPLNLHSINV